MEEGRSALLCLLVWLGALWPFGAAGAAEPAAAAKETARPNILWISCEDISPQLGCYGDPHAQTPRLDQLASEGVRFTRAFTPAGVCAVVRSSVITGMYAPAIGSQHMRSQIVPPEGVRCFTEPLRAAGYFCTNRSKTDYQFDVPAAAWDRQGATHADWRERPDPEQPFFSVVNLTISHEGQIRQSETQRAAVVAALGEENVRDPDAVADTLPAYLPDTPAVRRNWAWYLDNIARMDQMAGEVLDRLEEDGLADTTLVVFWSDHGMGMPRGKRWIYDTGTLVPMIVRWPGQLDRGSVREDLVSVLDLPPTMLDAAGAEVPRSMHGRILWGERAGREPAYLFFHRDRMDEAYELQRACRDRRWKYIRNFEPEKPYAQGIDYMDLMPAMQDWRRLAAEGQLSEPQSHWFAETKPVEELYDVELDPWELNNLADQPQYAGRLQRMRRAVERWQEEIGDTGMIPEAVLMEEMRPQGEIEQVAEPQFQVIQRSLLLRSETLGAAIVFRTAPEAEPEAWSDWQLYTGTLRLDPDTRIEAKASRAGYRDSEAAAFQVPPSK